MSDIHEYKVAYYCDGKASCSDSIGCYHRISPGIDYCRHTFEEDHAMFGKCEDPENHPERFHWIKEVNCFWEGEVFSSADLTYLNSFRG